MDEQLQNLYELKAEIIKAAGHPIRLAILDALREGPRCVCELAEKVEAGRSNVSRHLAVMVRAGLLSSRKDGLMVYYSLRMPCILGFFSCVDELLRERLRASASTLAEL